MWSNCNMKPRRKDGDLNTWCSWYQSHSIFSEVLSLYRKGKIISSWNLGLLFPEFHIRMSMKSLNVFSLFSFNNTTQHHRLQLSFHFISFHLLIHRVRKKAVTKQNRH